MIDSPPASRELNNEAFRLMLAGRLDQARAGFGRSLEVDPLNATALSNLGFLLTQLGELDEAISTLERATAADPCSPAAANNLGNALFAGGRCEDAIASYHRALAIDKSNAQARLNVAIAHHQCGQPSATRSTSTASTSRAVRHYGRAHHNVALAYQAQGQLEKAVRSFRAAASIAPDEPEFLLNLGGALFMAGDYDDAADAFERAKRLDPDDWAASYHLALALAAQQKAIRAIGELEALHERHPAAEPPTHSLAALYLAVGCADDAVALLEELATIHPDDDALQSDLQTARRMQNVQTGGPSAER